MAEHPLTHWVVSLTAADVLQVQGTLVAITEATLATLTEEDIPATGSAYTVIIRLVVCGDVSPAGGGDGVANVVDALRVLKISVGAVAATAYEQIAGDVNSDNQPDPDGDGDIDVLDALRVLKGAVDLVEITSSEGLI